jgi:hypothetical protein
MLAISKNGYFNKSLVVYLDTDKDIGKVQLSAVI